MKKQNHYIIGDIHAEYQTLLALVEKLPKDARLIFVGDLISRGSQGKEVIDFVRNNAFCCLRGNHEEYLLKFGSLFLLVPTVSVVMYTFVIVALVKRNLSIIMIKMVLCFPQTISIKEREIVSLGNQKRVK